MDESHMSYAMGKKLDSKGYILHDSIHMTRYERQNYKDGVQIPWLPGINGGGVDQMG